MKRLGKYDPLADILAMEQLTLQEELQEEENENEAKELKIHEASLLSKIADADENSIISLTKPRSNVVAIEMDNSDGQVFTSSTLTDNTSNSKVSRKGKNHRDMDTKSEASNNTEQDSYDTMIKECASVISKETGIATESLKSPTRMFLNPINLEKIYDKELSPEKNKQNRKEYILKKMGNVAKSSLEHISKVKTTNQSTTSSDESGQIEDEEMEFGQENSDEETIGKEDDGGEPTSDVSLGTYTSYKATQGTQSVEFQGSTQGTNGNKDNDYTSMNSASTYTNKQRSSEDSEPKMPIRKGTTNQEIDCNDITKITDTQTMDKDKTSNKAVNKDNLSSNIKQNKLQVQIKQEGITEAVNNLHNLPPKTRQNDKKNLSIIDDLQVAKGRRQGPITRADPGRKNV